MVDVVVSDLVAASPTVVFAFLADLANWPRWQSDMQTTTLIEGEAGTVGARYHYVSKALGQTIDSSVHLSRVDAPREVAFEGEWAGMIRPSGRYLVEAEGSGSRVTLNPHPEVRGLGRVVAPLMSTMIRRLNRQHLADLGRAIGESTTV